MNVTEFDIFVIFLIGIGFCLLLVGAMLAYIRNAKHGTKGNADNADLHDEVGGLLLAREALDADYQSNRISEDDYAATCLVIDRRILLLSQQVTDVSGTRRAFDKLSSLGVGLGFVLPVGAAIIYATLGRPDLADNPLANRAAEIASQNQLISETQQDLVENLTTARAASVAKPGDIESWLNLAKAAAAINDSATEIRALRMARQLTNDDPAILSLLAEALSRAADGQVTVPARALIDTVLASDPTDPRALFLWGLTAFQDGDYSDAITRWQSLLSISTPDAPWLPIVRQNIQQAAEAGDITPEVLTGPDADSIAAASNMSPEDREAMILSMVKALSNRLETAPDDTEGWLRLARAYDVLGDTDAAFRAMAQATESDPKDHSLSYQFLKRTIGKQMSVEQLNMARTVIKRLANDDTQTPQYLFFSGHLAKFSGDQATARAAWTKLLATMPANSEMASALAAEIAKLASP